MPPPRVVLVSTVVGHDAVPHAGGRYVVDLYRVLEQQCDVVVLSPGRRVNREAAARPGAPRGPHLLLGLEPGRGPARGLLNRVALNLDTRLRAHDPGMPYLPFLLGLALSREARNALRTADVVDLQWSDSIRLVHLLRRVNARARYVGTFHDVMSQALSRTPASTPSDRRRRDRLVRRSRRHEDRMVRALDRVLVFSEKDARLLGSPPNARVVHPPLAPEVVVRHEPGGDGSATVLVVAFWARPENERGAVWAIEQVWPRVLAVAPRARLRLVGTGASDRLTDLAERSPGVEVVGWVDDLSGEYAAAGACLVPVHEGAGVKFKTVDGLVRGVPVVTTTVGAEGIEGPELFARVGDTADDVASGIIDVLTHPERAAERSARAQEWVRGHYGRRQFEDAVLEAWGITRDAGPPD